MPSTIHCDHLIEAQIGGKEDLQRAKVSSNTSQYLRFTCAAHRISTKRSTISCPLLLPNMEWVSGSLAVESFIRWTPLRHYSALVVNICLPSDLFGELLFPWPVAHWYR